VHCQNVTDPLGWLIRPSAIPRHYLDGISVLCRIITYDQAEAGRSWILAGSKQRRGSRRV
jgi:single-strand DNA-binding protein